MMPSNPYTHRLAVVAYVGIIVGIILALVSNSLDATISNFRVDETTLFWKFATGLLADACVGIGIAAAIGWTVLAGVEWRFEQQARLVEAEKAKDRALARAQKKATDEGAG